MSLKSVGWLILCIGAVLALIALAIGEISGQHAAVDVLAILVASTAAMAGIPLWSIGAIGARRRRHMTARGNSKRRS